ncbi:hypothetical protein DFQ27_003976 [Actinomortierella ambigua]|uniref:F-box domain-containing protein n=1 Tax=Actinomortierella ambigua TaxID=1343610 RepID=A0A9P6U4N5_9FUNG|nr:hypothetical protein DFQ27_003976 [Actinomortierella ambigua]
MMATLPPNECLELILRHVDNDRDLHALLTVCKAFFHLAAARLYRDPFGRGSQRSERLLLGMVLALSLSPDERLHRVRQAFYEEHRSELEIYRQPTIDYLSLIRVVRWYRSPSHVAVDGELAGFFKAHLDNPGVSPSASKPRTLWSHSEKSPIRDMLTWAILGHPLARVEEIEIEASEIERFTAAADKLLGITTIVMMPKCYLHDTDSVAPYEQEMALVKAIQAHGRGRERLQAIRTFHLWSSLHETSKGGIAVPNALRLLSLLPTPRNAPCVPVKDAPGAGGDEKDAQEGFILLDQPLEADLTELASINIDGRHWVALRAYFPNLSKAQILQRCRGVTAMEFWLSENEDTDLLAWAAHESDVFHDVRRRYTHGHPSAQHCHQHRYCSPAPLVAVKSLAVRVSRPARRPRNLDVLNDGMHGFADTLESVHACLEGVCPRGFSAWPICAPPRVFPRLETLTLLCTDQMEIDSALWDRLPSLKALCVVIDGYYDDPGFCPEGDHDYDGIDALCWPILSLPLLERLMLEGRATRLFHPASLHHLPNLTTLKLSSIEWDDNCTGDSPLPCHRSSSGSGDGRYRLHPRELWTWDWPLVQLKELWITGDLGAIGVDLCTVLRTCPQLQDLHLGQYYEKMMSRSRPQLTVFPLVVTNHPVWDGGDGLTGQNNEPPQDEPFSHPSLKKIELQGAWRMERDQLLKLLGMLPGLSRLVIGWRSILVSDCIQLDLVMMTSLHPCLERLEAKGVKGDPRVLEQLGLQQVLDDASSPHQEAQGEEAHFYQRDILYWFSDGIYRRSV